MKQLNFEECYRVLCQFAADPKNPFGLTPSVQAAVVPPAPIIVQASGYKPTTLENLLLTAAYLGITAVVVYKIYNYLLDLIPIVNDYIGRAYDNRFVYMNRLISTISASSESEG